MVLGVSRTITAQPAADGLAAVAAIEETLVDVIARTEVSVVAIGRSSGEPGDLASRATRDPFGNLRRQIFAESPPHAYGAGVIIDADGLILTQYLNVVEGERHTVTTKSGDTYRAQIKAADPRSGLAVLEVNASGLPAIEFGDASQLRKGQIVVTLGNPYAIARDHQPTAAWGIVANLAQKASADVELSDPETGPRTLHHLGTLIQTDARLNWNAGGGALVNLRGEMIGLTTSTASIAGHEQAAGYAIPINPLFERIIRTLAEGREVEYGLLGISFTSEMQTPGERGVTVLQVYPGSPAERAGLRSGDLITHVDDIPVPGADQLQLVVGMRPPAETTEIRYQRRNQAETTRVTLAKYPVPGKQIVTNRPPAWRGVHVDYATAIESEELAAAIASGALDPDGCVLIREVEPESAAWRAGLRAGMFISHVGEQRVSTPAEFRAAVEAAEGTVGVRLTEPVAEPAGDEPSPDRLIPEAI